MAKKAPRKPGKKPAKPAGKKAPAKKTPPAARRTAKAPATQSHAFQEKLRAAVLAAIATSKGEDALCVDVRGQSALADFLVIASGRSSRQVAGMAENVRKALLKCGAKRVRVEGLPQGDWVVVDGGDVVAHLFRPEVRLYYRLEEVWGLEPPLQETFRNL